MGMKFRSLLLVPLLWVGCSTVPKQIRKVSPEELYKNACTPGKNVKSIRGVVWFKTNSKEISGQFSAHILASNPDHLKLEVTNFLGGTEAFITVDQDHYTISRGDGKNGEQREGFGSWGGIPLKWATDLFLGKVPCPKAEQGEKLSVGTEGELVVEIDPAKVDQSLSSQRYIYRFRDFEGKSWPESLKWEKTGTDPVTVDFKFDDPEHQSLSPQKWEARSNQGAIKVRWRDREVSY